MKKNLTKLEIIVVSIFIVFVIIFLVNRETRQEVLVPELVKNFIDLDKVEMISKFRSCQGHTVVPQDESESARNMKHYLVLKPEYFASGVKVYSPFDGIISGIRSNKEAGLEGEIWIGQEGTPWSISFEHIDLSPDLKEGQKLKAGEFIGSVPNRGIDIVYAVGGDGVKLIDGYNSPFAELDSVFSHMTDSVFNEYQKLGVNNREAFIYSQEFRDANPCKYRDNRGGLNDIDHPEDWVYMDNASSTVSTSFKKENLPKAEQRKGQKNETQLVPPVIPRQTITTNQKASCPSPFIFDLPIDINKATSLLYPGQIRGGEYKAHGGFRFDNSQPEEITVIAPIDAAVIAGARYPVAGEIQYTLDFEHSCGVRYRLGHLLTLAPKFQAIAEGFPLPTAMDSRTTQVHPSIEVKKGEIIATAVGLMGTGALGTGQVNTFLDWGVYDYRQKNEISKNPDWATAHTSEIYQYAVCWFDWISTADRVKVLALPSADGTSGKQSDYCK